MLLAISVVLYFCVACMCDRVVSLGSCLLFDFVRFVVCVVLLSFVCSLVLMFRVLLLFVVIMFLLFACVWCVVCLLSF